MTRPGGGRKSTLGGEARLGGVAHAAPMLVIIFLLPIVVTFALAFVAAANAPPSDPPRAPDIGLR